MKIKTRQFIAGLSLLGLAIGTFAADDHPAQTLVVEPISQLIDVLKTQSDRVKSDEAFLDEQIDKYIVPIIDFGDVTKLVVGKSWRKTKDKQRDVLVNEFKSFMLNTYSTALTEYSVESIAFEDFKPERRDDRAVIKSKIKHAEGAIPVVYKLRDKKGWLIYDIVVDGFSLITSQRAAFSNEIEKGGIEGLIKTLKDKNAGS